VIEPDMARHRGDDPSLFFDRNGNARLVNSGMPAGKPRYEGHRAIWIQQFDPAAMKLVGPRKVIVGGGTDPSADPQYVEGTCSAAMTGITSSPPRAAPANSMPKWSGAAGR